MGREVAVQDRKELKQIVDSLDDRFCEIAETHGAVNFKQECFFALQAVQNNSFLATIALRNPMSLRAAVLNIAAVGLTLNPALKYAHLVPRDGKVCLDIPYGGLIKIANDTGSVEWVQAELVRENDTFLYRGIGQMPEHTADYFGDRGSIKGGYCIAKLFNGDFLITVMSAAECFVIRDRTSAYKKYKQGGISTCPWVSDEGEMIKKTVIKRASKLWPKSERLSHAVAAINEHEGIDFEAEQKGEEKPSIQEIKGLEIKEKMEKIEQIAFLVGAATESLTLAEKGMFLKEQLDINSFDDLRKLSCDELDELKNKIKKEVPSPTIE